MPKRFFLLILTCEMDNHRVAAVADGVVNPELHIARIFTTGSTSEIKWIVDPSGTRYAIGRIGEGIIFFCPARSIGTDEPEPFGVVARIAILNPDIYKYSILIGRDVRNLRYQGFRNFHRRFCQMVVNEDANDSCCHQACDKEHDRKPAVTAAGALFT